RGTAMKPFLIICHLFLQNLNEYIAALIALKQKIIDAELEWEQKFPPILTLGRGPKKLHCQIPGIFLPNVCNRISDDGELQMSHGFPMNRSGGVKDHFLLSRVV
uniref:Uncharacterized protein n=1 Tax=Naja naja TaxID=35670 RepID=A0A8C6XXZ2_NAJNA